MSRVTFLDLLEHEAINLHECDVCIVGAGAGGIYAAKALSAGGLSVILVEGGGMRCKLPSEMDMDARFSASVYAGAVRGRAFGFGGTTSMWGGLLAPHGTMDLPRSDDSFGQSWAGILAVESRVSPEVLRNLGYPGPDDAWQAPARRFGDRDNAILASGFRPQSGIFLPLRKRNLATLLDGQLHRRSDLRVFMNAMAKDWTVSFDGSDARVDRLEAVSKNGRRLSIRASRFFIAAGAIESARILLELDAFAANRAIRRTAAVGRYLGDHLSSPIAEVVPGDRDLAASLFAPFFLRGWMRSTRLLELQPPRGSPRAFLHFVFDNTNPGFQVAKALIRARQSRRWPKVGAIDLLKGMGGGLALVEARYLRKRLHIPRGTSARFQLDMEQLPNRENRVFLGAELDAFGRPRAHIEWQVRQGDSMHVEEISRRVIAKWGGARQGLPELRSRSAEASSLNPYDAYHPTGTCRMGNDSEAVVDEELKVHGVANLHVISTAVLPTAGSANPTFTMLCLAHALCTQVLKEKAQGVRT